MSTMVTISFPVTDVKKSTAFYEKLGFTKNPDFSRDDVSAMVWDETFFVMLFDHEFYAKFINGKEIANNRITSGAMITFNMESADAVKKLAEVAKANGGDYYYVDMGVPEEQMFALHVQDLDGNSLEATWMNV